MPELKGIKIAHSNSFRQFSRHLSLAQQCALRIHLIIQNCVVRDILTWRSYPRRNFKYTTAAC
jgi:hypothetical protein